MTLGELIYLLRETILNDRTDRTSGSSDYLWTDATLVNFVNEAQRRFAVKGLVLRDGTTDDATKVTLVEGQTIYPLHESVIAVLTARRELHQTDINRVGHSLLGMYRPTSETWADPAIYYGAPDGPTLAFSTDEHLVADSVGSLTRVALRVYPTPRADEEGDVIRLRVIRKPLRKFVEADITDDTAIPEIPEDHHIEMLDWAAYLALRIVDDDAGAPKRADEFRASFEDHVRSARTLIMQKLFAPAPWGFGRGGFSWGR